MKMDGANETIAATLRQYGYEVAYGYDADVGPYAEISVDGAVIASANRLGSIYNCLREAVRQLEDKYAGVEDAYRL